MTTCHACHHENPDHEKFCRACGRKLRPASTEEKRNLVKPGDGGNGRKAAVIAVAAAAVIAAGTVFMLRGLPARTAGPAAVETPEGSVVSIPLSGIPTNEAVFYSYQAPSGKGIPYFLLRLPDGTVRAAFDACDVCFPSRKGYRQDGAVMVCNNCGQTFENGRIGAVSGGCNPSPLAARIEEGNLIIAVRDILAGGRYF